MKKLFTGFVLIASLCACSKKTNSPTGNSVVSNQYPNKVTVVTDNKTYTVQGYEYDTHPSKNIVKGYMLKETNGTSSLHIVTNGVEHEFEIVFDGIGPASGIGKFNLKNSFGYFEEQFQGGEKYDITSGEMDVKVATSSLIEGAYTLEVKNSGKSKSIIGSFYISKPGL